MTLVSGTKKGSNMRLNDYTSPKMSEELAVLDENNEKYEQSYKVAIPKNIEITVPS